jgi:hypothetical protein
VNEKASEKQPRRNVPPRAGLVESIRADALREALRPYGAGDDFLGSPRIARLK